MSEWKEYIISDTCSRLSSGKAIKASLLKDVGSFPVYGGNGIRGYTDTYNFEGECAIIGRQGAACGNVRYFSGKAYMTEHAVVAVPNEHHDAYYLSCVLASMKLGRLSGQSAQPGIGVGLIGKQVISLPPLSTQRRIASILSSLDDKIAINRRICENLEAQAQALFKHWFIDFAPFKNGKFVESELGMIPEGWRVGTLTEIAEYMNGLAMQKFPPLSADDAIPVLKIKELGQSQCDNNSDKCSKQIKPEYIIKNGDVVFSWSGTLMVDIWCGGICGLNQHLFKVTSDNYPKWFFFRWTKHHLSEFIRIAKDKAVTMGHIKRGDLEKTFVVIPDRNTLDKMSEVMENIHNQIINTRLESSRLSALRDTLLPRLMSGEIKVEDVTL